MVDQIPAPATSGARRKILILIGIAIVCTWLVMTWKLAAPAQQAVFVRPLKQIGGARLRNDSVTFEDLHLPALDFIVENKTIFFIAFNVPEQGINPLHACAYESAARHNPDSPVVVLVEAASPISSPPSHLSRTTYPNLHFTKINFSQLMEGTAIESLWGSPRLARARYRLYDMSDMLRQAVIAKFGGIYLDSDIIVLKTLPKPPTNYIVAEAPNSVNCAVLSFPKGHPLLTRSLNDLPQHFDGETWAAVGPILLTASVRSLCGLGPKAVIENIACGDFRVLSQATFYPVTWWDWADSFASDKQESEKVLDRLKDSYTLHYYSHNLKGSDSKLTMLTEQPLYKLMTEHCPVTEETELRRLIGVRYSQVLG